MGAMMRKASEAKQMMVAEMVVSLAPQMELFVSFTSSCMAAKERAIPIMDPTTDTAGAVMRPAMLTQIIHSQNLRLRAT